MWKFFAAGSGKPHAEGSEDLGGKISTARNSGNVPQEDALKLSRRRLASKKSSKVRRKRFYVRQVGSKSAACVSLAKAQIWQRDYGGMFAIRAQWCCKAQERRLQRACKGFSWQLGGVARYGIRRMFRKAWQRCLILYRDIAKVCAQ